MTNWLCEAFREGLGNDEDRKISKIEVSRVEVALVAAGFEDKTNIFALTEIKFSPKYISRDRLATPEFGDAAYRVIGRYFLSLGTDISKINENGDLSIPDELLTSDTEYDPQKRLGHIYGLGLIEGCLRMKNVTNKKRLAELRETSVILATIPSWYRLAHGIGV